MLRYLKEFGKYVEISGFRKVSFEAAETFLKAYRRQTQLGIDLQFFDADLVASPEHLYFAALNALQAFQNKTNHSKTAAMETILYASAQRQIIRAIERLGIKPQTKNIALLIIGEDPKQLENAVLAVTQALGSKPDQRVLELTKAKLEKIKTAFEISDIELETVADGKSQETATVDLVLERVALLATQF